MGDAPSGVGAPDLTFSWIGEPNGDGTFLVYGAFNFCGVTYSVGDHGAPAWRRMALGGGHAGSCTAPRSTCPEAACFMLRARCATLHCLHPLTRGAPSPPSTSLVFLTPEDPGAPLYLARLISAYEDTRAEGGDRLCIEVSGRAVPGAARGASSAGSTLRQRRQHAAGSWRRGGDVVRC
jgi:hypothetical protein